MSEIEKKRSPSESLQGETKKRKPLHELEEDGPLTQDEVIYFQKEAIWRQMNYFRKKAYLLSRDLRQYKQDYELNESKLNILDSWYEQIVNLFSGIENDSDLSETLLIRITNNDDETTTQNVLERRRQQLLRFLTPLVESIKAQSPIESKNLVEKFELLNSELVTAKSNSESLSKIKLTLEQKIEKLKEEILDLLKEKDRQGSVTLKRALGTKEENGDAEEEKPATPQAESKETTVPTEESTKVDSEELDKLNSDLEILLSTNELLSKQLQEVTEKYDKSQVELVQLDNRINNLQETDLEDNVHYNNVIKNNRSLQDQVAKLSKLNETNSIRLKELESKQNDIAQAIEKEVIHENSSLKEQLHKSESDLVRIRTARDELLAKNTILKSQVENEKTNEELHKLNKVLEERLQQIETAHTTKLEEDNLGLSNLTTDELISRVNLLSNEIKEIEGAFKETREVSMKKLASAIDQENLVKKLTIEKTKADQKYFASMRVKDSLQTENKILKAQVAKSQDVIKNLNELEKNHLYKIDILTKSINDYKLIKENSLRENNKLEASIKSLQNVKETFQGEIKKFSKTVEGKIEEISLLNNEVSQNKITINKLDRTLKSTENLLKKYKDNNTSSIIQEDEQQLEALRSIAKCSVCTKNWKDTAITVCGHVFCHSCTQERLAARLRRCPSCNKGFSANDLLSIHL